MRSRWVWLGFVMTLAAALAWNDDGDAQPPPKKGPPFGKGGPTAPVTTEQIVERLMSFDKNGDGKITADELPERMQHLIALGDVNKDGALDRGEITKLAGTLEAVAGLTGGPGGLPPPGLPKGAKGGPKGINKGPAGEVARTLDELNVTGTVRDKADRVLRATQDKQRRFDELTRAALMLEMKDILNEEDYQALKTALRPPGPPGFKGPRPDDLAGRIDQLQKDLDDLKRKLAK